MLAVLTERRVVAVTLKFGNSLVAFSIIALVYVDRVATPPHTNEDLGLTPLEARSVGVPCIVSKDGGVPETGGEHALRCEPNSVESLLTCLNRAVEMEEDEYERMSDLAKEGLNAYVRPLDEYAQEYLKLVGKK